MSALTIKYEIGARYLHAKTNRPVTLRYIGPLPLSFSPSSSSQQIWLGVEYDEPQYGKHSGSFQGAQIFQTREDGSGAFLKLEGEPLRKGKSLVESLEERYGAIDPVNGHGIDNGGQAEHDTSLVLGSSNGAIKIETNWQNAKKRVSRLERLRDMGFEEQYISHLGGDEDIKKIMRERLKGVKWVSMARNLLKSWDEIADIGECFPGLETLTLSHSRIQPLAEDLETVKRQRYRQAFCNVKELHLSDCLLNISDVSSIAPMFPKLELLHIEGNRTMRTLDMRGTNQALVLAGLKEIKLGGCPIDDWKEVLSLLASLPNLESLDLSFSHISSIPLCPSSSASYPSLRKLALLKSRITLWTDVDHLSRYFPGLTSLRFSLDAPEMEVEVEQNEATLLIPRSTSLQRTLVIPKFTSLATFNSAAISSSQRRDAELFYISYVARYYSEHSSPERSNDWGNYSEICRLHGKEEGEKVVQRRKPEALRARMFSLLIYTSLATPYTQTLQILPSAPINLLVRKLTRLLSLKPGISLWSIKERDGKMEKVANVLAEEVGAAREVGWWFQDGDGLYLEIP